MPINLIKSTLLLLLSASIVSSCKQRTKPADDNSVAGVYTAELTDAPNVPPSPGYKYPEKVVVKLEVLEKVMRLADGVEYNFWTFGGKVPGKFIRIREGDEVEFYLSNHPNNKLPHNIDLHAVTGPGGGAEASMTAPGHTTQFSFKAINPGLYVYHCATAPVGMHIGNGMYGLILVEPKEGLPPVDKEFYIMQGEFYTKERFGRPGLTSFDMEKALDEKPEYVVFNGSVGANMGDNAMQVKQGETVRLYVGNGGPNLVSSFHVIGEIFNKVHIEGGSQINENVATTLVPAGGTAIVEFKCEVPGSLTVVDHSVFRAFNKGALAQIKVTGKGDKEIFTGKQKDLVYQPEGSAIQSITPKRKEAPIPERTYADRMEKGKILYESNCAACHQKNGEGVSNAFPPLANSDYLMARNDKGIGIPLHGLSGVIKVNGKEYNGVMPQMQLTDDEIASVLTYVRNSWGNKGGLVKAEEVSKVRNGK
ncbi:copper-containing nitrite reductase [Rubrolithibacter danxiaensis]|uniref:copper-containing nitrite reductase n=1 Tax=Rubrolithibacter danxiaensis TaxID=3390805 RepID=UPI003BF920BE